MHRFLIPLILATTTGIASAEHIATWKGMSISVEGEYQLDGASVWHVSKFGNTLSVGAFFSLGEMALSDFKVKLDSGGSVRPHVEISAQVSPSWGSQILFSNPYLLVHSEGLSQNHHAVIDTVEGRFDLQHRYSEPYIAGPTLHEVVSIDAHVKGGYGLVAAPGTTNCASLDCMVPYRLVPSIYIYASMTAVPEASTVALAAAGLAMAAPLLRRRRRALAPACS